MITNGLLCLYLFGSDLVCFNFYPSLLSTVCKILNLLINLAKNKLFRCPSRKLLSCGWGNDTDRRCEVNLIFANLTLHSILRKLLDDFLSLTQLCSDSVPSLLAGSAFWRWKIWQILLFLELSEKFKRVLNIFHFITNPTHR